MLDGVRQYIKKHRLFRPGDRVGVAVSGGVDSVCLLHALAGLAELRLDLVVCHLDHGIRGDSGRDAEFVRDLAARSGRPFLFARLDVPSLARRKRLSLEMAARELRYAELRRMAAEHGLVRVALGHHRDDQVETILLRLIRGTGIEGLAGMQPLRDDGIFVRPLLETSRAAIMAYAAQHGLAWVEDHTNADEGILRNRVRHSLLPELRASYNPGIDRSLLGLAALAGEARAYLEEDLIECWPRLNARAIKGGMLFARAGLASMPPALGRLALRRLLAMAGGDPGRLSLAATLRLWEFAAKGGGRRLAVPGGFDLARRGEDLYLGRLDSVPATEPVELPVPGSAAMADGRSVSVEWWSGNLPAWADVTRNEAFVDGDVAVQPLVLRSRRPGDVFVPLGLGGRKKIKDVLIDAGIPREERAAVPLVLDAAGRIVWVAGIRLDERFRLTDGTRRVLHFVLSGG